MIATIREGKDVALIQKIVTDHTVAIAHTVHHPTAILVIPDPTLGQGQGLILEGVDLGHTAVTLSQIGVVDLGPGHHGDTIQGLHGRDHGPIPVGDIAHTLVIQAGQGVDLGQELPAPRNVADQEDLGADIHQDHRDQPHSIAETVL